MSDDDFKDPFLEDDTEKEDAESATPGAADDAAVVDDEEDEDVDEVLWDADEEE
ncbi:MAG TPA: hypothetical protein VJH63_03595 [Candidatus Paceibacterota bacterium]